MFDLSLYSALELVLLAVVCLLCAAFVAYWRAVRCLINKRKAESAGATQPMKPVTDPAKDAKPELEPLIQQIDDALTKRQIADLEVYISRIRQMLSDPNLKCTSRNIKILQDAIDSMRELINLKYERFLGDQPKNTEADGVKTERGRT